MAIIKDEGYVLKRSLIRETSLLVTLFTRSNGKIKILLKGIRTSKRSQSAACEPFTHLAIVYYEKLKSDIHLGSDVGILNAHSELRSRLDLLSHTSYVTESVDRLFSFHDPQADVFTLLGDTYRAMSQFKPEQVVRVFGVKLLQKVGWLPVLTQCAVCGTQAFGQMFLSLRQGGVVCHICERREPQTTPISATTLQSLVFFRDHSMDEAAQRDVEESTARELEDFGQRFLRFHLDYPLRSSKFITELRPLL
ncbi:MAG: DNA repair protein RecO [Omnitrophica bacterium RIFCSPLOWO2_01_FULL_50_24]|nr:MAG: DNA repair protein RecO [Omnitrophica bacterium RIFCSPLOWO2_01_FULL_50_24]